MIQITEINKNDVLNVIIQYLVERDEKGTKIAYSLEAENLLHKIRQAAIEYKKQ